MTCIGFNPFDLLANKIEGFIMSIHTICPQFRLEMMNDNNKTLFIHSHFFLLS